MQSSSLIIIGGNSLVGYCLMQRLAKQGWTARVISRRPLDVPMGFVWDSTDLNVLNDWTVETGATVISLLPLWVLAEFLHRFTGAASLIATGSTSRYSKTNSMDALERATAKKLEAAEEVLKKWAEQNRVCWTLLRPTLIYDCQYDKNITRMARFIRRWHFLPVGAPANGLRQPIHTDDVAKAIIKCLNNSAAANKAFNISGCEMLSYRAMAERVFTALGQKPRFVMLPVNLLRQIFHFATRLGILKEASFGSSIFQRMNEDLVFDTAEGLDALDYQPRGFAPEFPDMRRG